MQQQKLVQMIKQVNILIISENNIKYYLILNSFLVIHYFLKTTVHNFLLYHEHSLRYLLYIFFNTNLQFKIKTSKHIYLIIFFRFLEISPEAASRALTMPLQNYAS